MTAARKPSISAAMAMVDRIDQVIAETTGPPCGQCGVPLDDGSTSLYHCSQACQRAWSRGQARHDDRSPRAVAASAVALRWRPPPWHRCVSMVRSVATRDEPAADFCACGAVREVVAGVEWTGRNSRWRRKRG